MRSGLVTLSLVVVTALAAGCASQPTRNYRLRGPESFYSPAQAESAREWHRKRGIYDHVVYGPTTVSFKYGSDEVRTMGYDAFDAFVRDRLAGHTTASARRPDYNSSEGAIVGTIIYWGSDGHVAQWGRGSAAVTRGTWWFEPMPEPEMKKARALGVVDLSPHMLCMQIEPINGLPECTPGYENLLGVHGKRAGDVFNLMSGKAPGVLNDDAVKTWPDGGPLFPYKAPQD